MKVTFNITPALILEFNEVKSVEIDGNLTTIRFKHLYLVDAEERKLYKRTLGMTFRSHYATLPTTNNMQVHETETPKPKA